MMLGMGDIVVPGLFISLALRYDHFRHTRTQLAGPFLKPYFTASLTAYVAGLATTMTFMHVFRAAQPALLYLRCVGFLRPHVELPFPEMRDSPACIFSFVLTAWRRGELIEAWKWNDGDGLVATSQKGRAVDKLG